jgi:hypothetical protein
MAYFQGVFWHSFGNNGEESTSSVGIDSAVSKIQDVYFQDI